MSTHAALVKTITVRVSTSPSDASLKLYQDKNGDGVLSDDEEKKDSVGASVSVVLEVKIGKGQQLKSSNMVVRVKDEYSYEDAGLKARSQFDESIDLTTTPGWQKKDNGTWQDTTETPRAQNATQNDMYYRRRLFGWGTTSAPLGNNGSHSLKVVSVDGDSSKTQLQFGPPTGTAKDGGPNALTTEVKNLVVTKFEGSGSPHYIKFDPGADDGSALKNPTISFTFENASDMEGSHNRYHWWVWLRETTVNGPSNFVTYEGFMDKPGQKTVTVNKSDSTYTKSGDVTAWGIYAFDLSVEDTKGGWDSIRSSKISIPNWMVDEHGQPLLGTDGKPLVDENGGSRPGHSVDGWATASDDFKWYASYYLESDKDASDMEVDFLDPDFKEVTKFSGETQKRTPRLDKNLYTPQESDEAGTYIGVFVPTDDYKEWYRNHENKSMLAINKRKWRPRARSYSSISEVDTITPAATQHKRVGYQAETRSSASAVQIWNGMKGTSVLFTFSHGQAGMLSTAVERRGDHLIATGGLRGRHPANSPSKYTHVADHNAGALSSLSLAVFYGCNTGTTDPGVWYDYLGNLLYGVSATRYGTDYGNIPDEVIGKGATTAVGYTDELWLDGAPEYSQLLWSYLCVGGIESRPFSVRNSLILASVSMQTRHPEQEWIDSYDKYYIAGSDSLTISTRYRNGWKPVGTD